MITMTTATVPIRFTQKDIEEMERFVKEGYFSTKSDLIRTSVRHYLREIAFKEFMQDTSRESVKKEELESINREIRDIREEIWKREFRAQSLS
ncbi:MAG: ribbon-helix-helix domain-containing protein [Candidatus Hydrothermarchaeales archaeon]